MRLLLKHLSDESFKDINLILNNTNQDLLDKNKINILWMQHFVNQKEAQNLASKDYINELDYIVFNSNWNFEKFQYQFKIPEEKSLVIRNAIEKIEYKEKSKEKINLIYHTTPWRGLIHLLKVFKNLNLENVELNVCSSTIIYGKKFDDILGKKFEKTFEECKSTSNLGALYETCAPFGTLVSFDRNFDNFEKKFEKVLLYSIKNFWSEENQKKLKMQRETINLIYSWDSRTVEWKRFFDEARKLKK